MIKKIIRILPLFLFSALVFADNNPCLPMQGCSGVANDNANTITVTAPMNFPSDLAWQHLYDISPSGIASFTLGSGIGNKFSIVDGNEGTEDFAVTNDFGVSIQQGFNLQSDTGNIFSGDFNTTDSNIVYATVCLSPFNCASAPFPALSTHSGLAVLTYSGGGIFNTTSHAFDIWDGSTWHYLLSTNHVIGSGGTTITDNSDGTITASSLATASIVQTSGNQTIGGTKTFTSTIAGSISGNAATVTTNANLTGDVTSSGNATTLASSGIAKVISITTVSGTSQQMTDSAVTNRYILQNSSLTTLTLPTAMTPGHTLEIIGGSTALWKIAQNASQFITTSAGGSPTSTTVGVAGHADGANNTDSIVLGYNNANQFVITSVQTSGIGVTLN